VNIYLVKDGVRTELVQVDSDPAPGEFTLSGRTITFGSPPQGVLVYEVEE